MKPINLTPGTVLVIGALSLSAGWLAGKSAAPADTPQATPAAQRRSGERSPRAADDVAPFTGQLRKRLDAPPPRTPATGRNPFVFGSRRSPSVTRDRVEADAAPAPMTDPVPFTPPVPQFKLSGIAASVEAGATVLTAIINDNGALAFVKAGDKLSSGATVVSISETAVVIMDVAGVSQTLHLP